MLKITGLNVYYGAIHAIKDVSLEVNEGEIVTLIGANGAGKSTVLRTVSGLLRAKSGTIEYCGQDITKSDPRVITTSGLMQVPEGRRVFLRMTVQENLEMGAYTRPASELKASLENVYARFPRLYERRKQSAGTLSGGEQQMLAIGRALMAKPKLIMLDEPSMGLAPMLVQQIFGIVREFAQGGVTVLLVEQNARMALTIADRGYVLETGSIVLEDSAANLLINDRVKKAYLGG